MMSKMLTDTLIHKSSAIIIKDKKILVERSAHKDYYVAPGGKIEPGEDAKKALVRKLKGEFKITVKEEDLEEFGVFNAKATGHKDRTVKLEIFIVKKWKGTPTPVNEVEDIKWITSKIPKNLKVGSIYELEVIPRLKKKNLIS